MLTTVMQVPFNMFYLARRTTSLSVMMVGEVAAAVFPSLLMPRDRIAWEAWATGYLAEGAPSAEPPLSEPSRTAARTLDAAARRPSRTSHGYLATRRS